jgi:glycerol-3-phosphate O-acyltransferase
MAEDKKKLFFILQDEFFAIEDAYNEAADHLQKAISNFVKAERSACNDSTDSIFREETKSSSLKLPRMRHFLNFPVNFPNGKISAILSNV